MDQASAQTEKIASYETSRTRRSIVDGNLHSDDSNNDEEYATSGFYVREKTSEKRPDSASSASKGSEKECKENGVSPKTNSPSSVQNGEDSEDGETSQDFKKDANNDTQEAKVLGKESKNADQPSLKEDIEQQNETPNLFEKQDSKKTDSKDEEGSTQNKEKVDDSEERNKNDKSLYSKLAEEESLVKEDKNEKKETSSEKEAEDTEIKMDIISEKQTCKDEQGDIDFENNEEKNKQKNDDVTKDNEAKQDLKVKKKKNKVKQGDKQDDKTKEDKTQKKPDSPMEIAEENTENKHHETDEKKDKDKQEDKKDQNASKTGKENSEGSILKDHLEKTSSGNNEESVETEMEMDEDFDPSLLCPDISMDVDEAPVITNQENAQDDGSTSPLPYEATFSTLVDEITGAEVQVDLTPEEMELRTKMYGPNNLVQTTKVHCTACNIHLGSALTGANNRFVHPLLKVLICKNCYHFYTSGEFEKDEDGSELYCRWCGQGGQVLCCSSCEFVFCKRCIRNNFGPKKFKEIRDSDDWSCFRCDRGQLSNLRASCAEFMEYYRTELARAQALSRTNPELMTTDYTTCCKGGTEKKEENKTPVQSKGGRRKRKDEEDPDYHPVVEDDGEPPKKKFGTSVATSVSSGGPGYTIIPPASSVRPPVVPRPVGGPAVRPFVVQQGQKPQTQNQGQVFKVGNTTFRAKVPSSGPGYTLQRPTVTTGQKSNSPGYITIPPSAGPKSNSPGYITIPPSAVSKSTSPGYITIPPSAAPKTTSPGYIKILPQRTQGSRPPNSYTVVSGTNNGKPTFTTVPPKLSTGMTMKHEWFEKTVRAAARVNSNLSYTLTQLNRQQSQASSVEALAMVHNKLQEVLSTSINSLIQIRKNLRTEFISGIKNIKFPPKPAPIPPTSGPIIVKDDDDVIFVNSPQPASTLPPPPPLVLSPSVSLTKKTPIQKTSDPFADPKPSTSGVSPKPNSTVKPLAAPSTGGFLKVRSFTSLQTVPSECITIPDDPPAGSDVKIIEEEDPLKITDEDKPKDDKTEPEPEVPAPEPDTSTFDEFMVYNVTERPTAAIKKMLDAVVRVKKSRVVDEIIRAQGLLSGKGKEKDGETKKKEEKVKESKKEDGKENDGKKKEHEENEAKKQEDKDTKGKKKEDEENECKKKEDKETEEEKPENEDNKCMNKDEKETAGEKQEEEKKDDDESVGEKKEYEKSECKKKDDKKTAREKKGDEENNSNQNEEKEHVEGKEEDAKTETEEDKEQKIVNVNDTPKKEKKEVGTGEKDSENTNENS